MGLSASECHGSWWGLVGDRGDSEEGDDDEGDRDGDDGDGDCGGG